MRVHKIASIPADGIGPEVIPAGLEVLDALAARDRGFRLEVEHFPWSSDYYLQHGHYIPGGGLEKLKTFDAIFSAPSAACRYPIMCRYGDCGCRSRRASTNMRTFARRAC